MPIYRFDYLARSLVNLNSCSLKLNPMCVLAFLGKCKSHQIFSIFQYNWDDCVGFMLFESGRKPSRNLVEGDLPCWKFSRFLFPLFLILSEILDPFSSSLRDFFGANGSPFSFPQLSPSGASHRLIISQKGKKTNDRLPRFWLWCQIGRISW